MTLHIPDHPELPTQDILRAAFVLNNRGGDRLVLRALIAGLYIVHRTNVKLRVIDKEDSLGNKLKAIRLVAYPAFSRLRRWPEKLIFIELIASPRGLYETCNTSVDRDWLYSTLADKESDPDLNLISLANVDLEVDSNWSMYIEEGLKGREYAAPFSDQYKKLISPEHLPEDFSVFEPKPMFPIGGGGGDDGRGRNGRGRDGGGRGNGGDGVPGGGDGSGEDEPGDGAGLADVLRHNVLFSAPERLIEILDQI